MQNGSSVGLLERALSALEVVAAPLEALRVPIKLALLKLTHTHTMVRAQPWCFAEMPSKLRAKHTDSKDPT